MRTIKFRVWSTINEPKMIPWVQLWNSSMDGIRGSETWKVMQYTGLKDKNGVDIYEGDIAIWYVNDIQRTGEIYYTGQAFDMRNDITGYGYIGWDALRGEIEVIGNIHQNPELLTP